MAGAGNLYATNDGGGDFSDCYGDGYGTAFKLSLNACKPTISPVTADPSVLWSPDHKMVL